MHPISISANGGLPPDSIYEVLGQEGFTRLVAAFYAQIPDDDILGPMYADLDMAAAEKRLRDFLIFRFGGPQTYIEERGHPRLRMRHMPFRINQSAQERWLELMGNALAEAQIPEDAAHLLRQFFQQVSTFMINSNDEAEPHCPVDHSQLLGQPQPQQQDSLPPPQDPPNQQ